MDWLADEALIKFDKVLCYTDEFMSIMISNWNNQSYMVCLEFNKIQTNKNKWKWQQERKEGQKFQ